MAILSTIYAVFFWVGFLAVVPYLALVVYAAYATRTFHSSLLILCCSTSHLRSPSSLPRLCRVLVTGGSSGIGAAITRKLASQGLNVVIVALADSVLEKFETEITKEFPQREFRFVGCDLSKPDFLPAVRDATKDLGVSIVCNNAGFISTGMFADIGYERNMANYHTNATAAVMITHHFMNEMLNNGRKGLFTFTSSSASFIPSPMSAIYGTCLGAAIGGMKYEAQARSWMTRPRLESLTFESWSLKSAWMHT
ncbi:hypothetical protein BC938DRAFT_477537 [Jimgerdemannia flammicorona]|uniref:Uncharacterized protein n=1 Tax=Jimgerdemannia flammicorona TaxID=994334 RepID=A0A433P948_9FUNG|nr:hypothetical protein BC938DRAFT_477537 [Jimgerdemannia flammicorona]